MPRLTTWSLVVGGLVLCGCQAPPLALDPLVVDRQRFDVPPLVLVLRVTPTQRADISHVRFTVRNDSSRAIAIPNSPWHYGIESNGKVVLPAKRGQLTVRILRHGQSATYSYRVKGVAQRPLRGVMVGISRDALAPAERRVLDATQKRGRAVLWTVPKLLAKAPPAVAKNGQSKAR
jgi:hypothetical protein